mmetsp:Transcript_18939/g.35196  ORF Transcript_18939/g.35196 Transcript_18939/m.35196 type:complete len:355 (-) Transcript_18939:558-1622(-)
MLQPLLVSRWGEGEISLDGSELLPSSSPPLRTEGGIGRAASDRGGVGLADGQREQPRGSGRPSGRRPDALLDHGVLPSLPLSGVLFLSPPLLLPQHRLDRTLPRPVPYVAVMPDRPPFQSSAGVSDADPVGQVREEARGEGIPQVRRRRRRRRGRCRSRVVVVVVVGGGMGGVQGAGEDGGVPPLLLLGVRSRLRLPRSSSPLLGLSLHPRQLGPPAYLRTYQPRGTLEQLVVLRSPPNVRLVAGGHFRGRYEEAAHLRKRRRPCGLLRIGRDLDGDGGGLFFFGGGGGVIASDEDVVLGGDDDGGLGAAPPVLLLAACGIEDVVGGEPHGLLLLELLLQRCLRGRLLDRASSY